MKRTLLLALLAAPLWAQGSEELQYTPTVFGGTPNFNWGSRQKLYYASQVVFVASQAADLASNWSGPEANRFLATNGRMDTQGRLIKIGFAAGVLALQKVTPRSWRKGWTIFNLIVGGTHTGVAVRNWRTK